MRKVTFCLALAVCAWMLAARPRAEDERAGPRFQQQWRIFPHAPFRRAADERIIGRLTRQIDPLLALLRRDANTSPLDSVGDSLIENKARAQLFRLESLLRLYVRAFPELEKYRLEVKDLEDGLGAYTFAVDSLSFAEEKFTEENQARAPSAVRKAEQEKVLEGLRKKKEAARVIFAKRFGQSTLDSDLPELRSALASSFAGWDASNDLAFVNRELQRILRNARYGRFNFTQLEDGIHEFRRRLRWFPVLIDSLDGLIIVRDDPAGTCPVPALESLAGSSAATHRYANPPLRFPAARPCAISRCLLWQVVKTTNELGRLKDDVQGNASVESVLYDNDIDVASSNRATAEEIARATAIRTELFSSRALESLLSQLSSCKS